MNVALIAIGDELLIGQVVNRNAAWISSKCTELGITVCAQSVVGDDADGLRAEITRMAQQADVVIMTGGLGPTHDDITKYVLAEMTEAELVVNEDWLTALHAWMERSGRELTPRNADQARVPASATIIHNAIGTAPGLIVNIFTTRVIALPGVPAEMKAMMTDHVLPMLSRDLERMALEGGNGTRRQFHVLQTTGIVESNLADLLQPVQEALGTTTLAFLPNYHGVRLRVGALGSTQEERSRELDRVTTAIRHHADRFIFGEGETTLAEAVGLRLKERNETVAVAESCTGGMLGAAFTDIAGSSAWFEGGILSYSNRIKVQELHVSQHDLDTVGAVSEEVALQMARGVREKMGTTWGIGITGVAGPGGGTAHKPVGTVWISVSGPKDTTARKFVFSTDRAINRERSVGAALAMLWGRLR